MIPSISRAKDDTLLWLCSNIRLGQTVDLNWPELINAVGLNMDAVEEILGHFGEMGMVEITSSRGGTMLKLKVKAYNLLQAGGFSVIDALNEANIQKMLLELENLQRQLKPDQMDALNKVTSIVSSVATVLTAFSGKD